MGILYTFVGFEYQFNERTLFLNQLTTIYLRASLKSNIDNSRNTKNK